jgi:hypothetical protein
MHTCVTVVASLISSHNPISAYSRKHAASSFAYFAIVMDSSWSDTWDFSALWYDCIDAVATTEVFLIRVDLF